MKQAKHDSSDLGSIAAELSYQSTEKEDIMESGENKNVSFLQLTIIQIWRDLLEVPSFGLNDDLFDLGGDSVTAIQVFSEINKKFGIRLPMEELFKGDVFSISWLSHLVERYLIEMLGKEEFDALMSEDFARSPT